jgi:hypothetical protein
MRTINRESLVIERVLHGYKGANMHPNEHLCVGVLGFRRHRRVWSGINRNNELGRL